MLLTRTHWVCKRDGWFMLPNLGMGVWGDLRYMGPVCARFIDQTVLNECVTKVFAWCETVLGLRIGSSIHARGSVAIQSANLGSKRFVLQTVPDDSRLIPSIHVIEVTGGR